jgi:hypothetical protein
LPLIAHRHFLHPANILALRGANFSPLSHMFAYNRSMYPHETRAWHYLSRGARYLAAATICLILYVCHRLRREGGALLRILLGGLSIVTLGLTILAGHLPGIGEIPGALPVGPELVDLRAHIFVGTFLTLVLALLCYWSVQKITNSGLADFLMGLALLSFLMTTRWSLVIWNKLRPLGSMQFPWRFNVFIAIAAAGLAALAIANFTKRPLRERVPVSVLAIIVWGIVAVAVARANFVEDSFRGVEPVAYKAYRDESLPVCTAK